MHNPANFPQPTSTNVFGMSATDLFTQNVNSEQTQFESGNANAHALRMQTPTIPPPFSADENSHFIGGTGTIGGGAGMFMAPPPPQNRTAPPPPQWQPQEMLGISEMAGGVPLSGVPAPGAIENTGRDSRDLKRICMIHQLPLDFLDPDE